MTDFKSTQPVDYYHRAFFGKGIIDRFHWERVSNILREIPWGSIVLDLGCGSGLACHLAELKECVCYGYDIREECIAYAKNRARCSVFTCDNLIEGGGWSFNHDVVLINDFLEHLTHEQLVAVCKNAGRPQKIIITVPSRLELWFEKLLYHRLRKWKNPDVVFDDEDRHRLVTAKELRPLFPGYTLKTGLWCRGMTRYFIFCGGGA